MIRFPKPVAFKKFACARLAVPAAVLLVGHFPAVSVTAAPGAADLAPPDSLVFVSLPDPVHTYGAWRGTELFKLWREPEVQTFLERPLSRVPVNPAVNEILARIGKVEPREVFAALVPAAEQGGQPRLVAGFRFDPRQRAELDALLAGPKGHVRSEFPAGKAETADHRGQPIEIFRTGHQDDLLATATTGGQEGWYLLSSDLGLLRSALDRLTDGPRTEPRPAGLGAEADFRAVRVRLPGDLEALTFLRPAAIADQIPEAANVPADQRAKLKDVRAAGAATAFTPGGQIRDVLFALMPGQPAPAAGPLDLPALALGSAADAVFFGSARLPSRGPSAGAGGTLGAALGGVLAGRGLTPEDFSAAFGEEIGLVFQWTEGAEGAPAGTVALPVRNRAAAETLLGKIVAVPFQEARWDRRTLPDTGATAYVLHHGGGATLTPTLVLGDRFLFLAGSPESARVALAQERKPAGNPADTLAGAESFRSALAAAGPTPDLSFAYLDWRRLFERAYAAARPMLAVSALVMPKLTEVVDVDHLPAATTVSRHLTPASLSQRGTSDGILLESTGPLPLTQAAGLSVVGLYLGVFAGNRSPQPQGTPEADKKAPAPEANISPR